MTEFDDRLLSISPRIPTVTKFHVLTWTLVPLAAILFQIYVPRFAKYLSYLELPLLVTVYFSLMRRQPMLGSLTGAVIGLAQDSLSNYYLGMFGIVKTLVGFLASSISLRFDVDNPALRFLVCFGLFIFHQVSFWALGRFLVGMNIELQIPQAIISGFLNAMVSVPLFLLLDRLRVDTR